jgi:Asp-tRNA(Asn)/Glu-tRNA(Gln) amidotransferase A subunit family amidase
VTHVSRSDATAAAPLDGARPFDSAPPLDSAPPHDRLLDRRSFLARSAAFGAFASSGGLAAIVGGCATLPAAASPAPATRPAVLPPSRITNPAAWAASVRPQALGDATELTIAEAARLIRDRRLHPLELVDAYLHRIARFEDVYRAYNLVLYDGARADAQRLGDVRARGPLHGIPLAIKDLFYTAGVPTTANSFIFRDFVPTFDATVVARLRAEGAIALGKTQMGPLATTRATTPTGDITTVNAWTPQDPSVQPGGSSTGSATAVAGRLATSSLGTQTGGSITAPSNAQGLTGLKPTMGRVSVYGVIPLSYTRDHPGPIARDALDAAILLQALAGEDPDDPRTHGLPAPPDYVAAATPVRRRGRTVLRWPTTIGVIPGYIEGDGAQHAARRAMLATFEAVGARVTDVTLPEDWSVLTGSAFNNVRLPERSEQLLEYLKQDVRLFGVSLSGWINGLLISGDEYLKGQRAKMLLLRRVLDDLFAQCDVVVQTSPVPFDIIGLPEIAFPIGFEPVITGEAEDARPTGRERPVGAILGGMPWGEERLLSLAAAFQAETDWHRRRPPDPRRGEGGGEGQDAGRRGARGRLTVEDVVAATE